MARRFTGYGGVGGIGSHGAHAWYTISQSIPNNVLTKHVLDSTMFDSDTYFDNANDRLTVPAGQAGRYVVIFGGTFVNSVVVSSYQLQLLKNGVLVAFINGARTADTDTRAAIGSILLNMVAGDYVELWVFQNTGGAINFYTWTGAAALNGLMLQKVG